MRLCQPSFEVPLVIRNWKFFCGKKNLIFRFQERFDFNFFGVLFCHWIDFGLSGIEQHSFSKSRLKCLGDNSRNIGKIDTKPQLVGSRYYLKEPLALAVCGSTISVPLIFKPPNNNLNVLYVRIKFAKIISWPSTKEVLVAFNKIIVIVNIVSEQICSKNKVHFKFLGRRLCPKA